MNRAPLARRLQIINCLVEGNSIRSTERMVSGSCLIWPPEKWTVYSNAWSAASERLTGITREMLDGDGLPPREALHRFLTAVADRDLFSDAPDFDAHWLSMLADAAGMPLGARHIGDANALLREAARLNDAPGGGRHRAEPDARRLALALYPATPRTR